MDTTHLTTAALMRPGRGIFVADEYVEALLETTPSRLPGRTLARYVEMVLATPGVGQWLSGVARGAAASQAEDVLPLVTVAMPDLASHSAAVTHAVTGNALSSLFAELVRFGVDTSALLLRINMVVPGDRHPVQTSPADVARATLEIISQSVPADVPDVVFLAGGQPVDQAAANLVAIRDLARQVGAPWQFTFAFARPLVPASVEGWKSDSDESSHEETLLESWRRVIGPMSSSASTTS